MFGLFKKDINPEELLTLICMVLGKSSQEKEEGKDTFQDKAMAGLTLMLLKEQGYKTSSKLAEELRSIFWLLQQKSDEKLLKKLRLAIKDKDDELIINAVNDVRNILHSFGVNL